MVCRFHSPGDVSFVLFLSIGKLDRCDIVDERSFRHAVDQSGVPGSSDNVTILNGRTISIVTNNKQVSSLTINSGGILDITSTTGHNFGTVSGQGKMMLSSNTFPGGTFTSFVAGGGGTIEYYNLNNVSISTTQMTYNNLIISNYTGSSVSTYANNFSNPTTYTINGNFNLKNYSVRKRNVLFWEPDAIKQLHQYDGLRRFFG